MEVVEEEAEEAEEAAPAEVGRGGGTRRTRRRTRNNEEAWEANSCACMCVPHRRPPRRPRSRWSQQIQQAGPSARCECVRRARACVCVPRRRPRRSQCSGWSKRVQQPGPSTRCVPPLFFLLAFSWVCACARARTSATAPSLPVFKVIVVAGAARAVCTARAHACERACVRPRACGGCARACVRAVVRVRCDSADCCALSFHNTHPFRRCCAPWPGGRGYRAWWQWCRIGVRLVSVG